MAKVKAKSPLKTVNKILFTVFILLLVATILIVSLSSAKVAQTADDTAEVQDELVIDELAPNTYGGVSLQSLDDIVSYYNECYDYTKSLTAQYKDSDGNTQTYYALLGEEELSVENILIEGKENSMINNLVPSVVGGLYSPGLNGLSPCSNRDPKLDVDVENNSLTTSRLTTDDLLGANAVDNGDGTITLTLQPKLVNMSTPGLDAQGHVFTTLGDIGSIVDGISVLSWASGSTEDNVIVNYMGGTAIVKIDTATKEIVEADYHEIAQVSVTHANVAVLKDKNAALTIKYDVHFPASDEYLQSSKGVSRIK